MATTYPQQTQTFPQMMEITAADGTLISQYQTAMQAGNLTLAKSILEQIPSNQNKIITADYLNTINDTLVALQKYFDARYSPAYIVSETQPSAQETGDFWFDVEG